MGLYPVCAGAAICPCCQLDHVGCASWSPVCAFTQRASCLYPVCAGAGVAALLALHYRARYSSVRAWCFAPPGGLMSPAAAASLKDICYSLVSAKVSRTHTQLTAPGGWP